MNPHAPNVMKNQVDISGKIKSQHLNRKAVIYIRQSTLQQVHRHQESTRLQYGLVDRAHTWFILSADMTLTCCPVTNNFSGFDAVKLKCSSDLWSID